MFDQGMFAPVGVVAQQPIRAGSGQQSDQQRHQLLDAEIDQQVDAGQLDR